MPYKSQKPIKRDSEIKWGFVLVAALFTFGFSVLLGKWIGSSLMNKRADVKPLSIPQQIYSQNPTPTPMPTPQPSPDILPPKPVEIPALQVPPPVVETPPSPAPSPNVTPSMASKNTQPTTTYRVQIGAFKSTKDATALQKSLLEDGYNSNVKQISQNGKTLYQVFLGPYSDPTLAQSIAHELTLLGYQPIVVGNAESTPPSTNSPKPSTQISPVKSPATPKEVPSPQGKSTNPQKPTMPSQAPSPSPTPSPSETKP
jgi:hypothetical protein